MKTLLPAGISLFSNCAHPASDQVAELLSTVDATSEPIHLTAPEKVPLACRHLAQAFSNQTAIGFCQNIAAVSGQLIWTEAPRGKISSFMDDNHAMAQIVGPDRGIFSEKLRFGAFLLAPNTIYPLHSHAAEEIYIPVSGSGQWHLQGSSMALKNPGSVVHCKSWLPHSIRSGKDPLLMVWAWIGNISFDAYRIEPNGFDEVGNPK